MCTVYLILIKELKSAMKRPFEVLSWWEPASLCKNCIRINKNKKKERLNPDPRKD